MWILFGVARGVFTVVSLILAIVLNTAALLLSRFKKILTCVKRRSDATIDRRHVYCSIFMYGDFYDKKKTMQRDQFGEFTGAVFGGDHQCVWCDRFSCPGQSV